MLTFSGTNGNDTLTGGAGNDTLTGGYGSDIYRFGVGSGNDTIKDFETYVAAAGSDLDRVELVGLNVNDVALTRGPNSELLVTIKSTGEVLTVSQQFHSTNLGIEQIAFKDGTIWNRAQIDAAVSQGTAGNDVLNGDGNDNTLFGQAGNDTLKGQWGNDTLDGGAGNDNLWGDGGSDTYVFGAGSGNDLILDYGTASDVDQIVLNGLNAGNVTFGRSGNDLRITVKATGEILTVQDQFPTSTTGYGIEKVVFADGTVWGRSQIESATSVITGTTGNDTLMGTAGSDTLDGGIGNDILNGGVGSDTFVFGTGFGKDTINDFAAGAGSVDVIEFQQGVFGNLSAVLGASTQVGADVVITVDANNSLTLKEVALSNLHADDFRFVA